MALTRPAGTWTYDDLLTLPDDGTRYEIIDGDLFELPAPDMYHATTLINLVSLLHPTVESIGGRIYAAPLAVFFLGADPVQPDIIVMTSDWDGRLRMRGAEGAPNLVIEILDPSNRVHDPLTKRALYGRARVREYWIVDPIERMIDVFSLDGDALHLAQRAAGADAVVSPLLDGATFPLAAIFAKLDEIEDE